MTFVLTIELGNDAMQTFEDIANKLKDVAKQLTRGPLHVQEQSGRIMDANGNTVGHWEVK